MLKTSSMVPIQSTENMVVIALAGLELYYDRQNELYM